MRKPVFFVLILSLFLLSACSLRKPVLNEKTDTISGTAEPVPTISVYFGNTNFNPNAADCGAVYPLKHTIAGTDINPTLALQELFKGPSAAEKAQSYYSWFSEATAGVLNNVVVENNIARVDLKDIRTLIPNASTSCGSAELLAEMTTTLKQFTDINQAIFSINGNTATFYEWLQLSPPSQ